MENVLSTAEQILRASGAPALRLGSLLSELRLVPGGSLLDAPRLQGILEAHPHRFRVLDPWRGPWRPVGEVPRGAPRDPWVVAVRDQGDGSGVTAAAGLGRKVRESVRWLGLTLDPTSPRRVIRWQALVAEGERAQRSLRRAA